MHKNIVSSKGNIIKTEVRGKCQVLQSYLRPLGDFIYLSRN